MSIKRLVLTTAALAATGGIFLVGGAPAFADETVDTSRWRCRFCTFPSGWEGVIRGGIGYVSEDSAKFGEYSDLDEEGLYPAFDGEATFHGEGTSRWDVIARDLGLDTRYISLSGGRQGLYELELSYDGIVRHVSDSARTPFRHAGDNSLRLPAGWTRASSTGAMSDLTAGLRDVDLETRRRRTGLEILFQPSENWSYTFDAWREERDGRKSTGAGFINSTAQLPDDVDNETGVLDLGARYTADVWQLGLNYRGSFFDNEHDRLAWDNPYSFPGPERGRASTAPDNEAHQIRLSGSYRFGARAFFVGDVTAGRMRQDEDLLPFTVNPDIAVPSLPRDSADAEVDTLTANGRLTYRTPLPRLSVIFDYRVDRRDNDTPRDAFTQVVTDSFVGDVRINEPLSYSRYRSGVEANYRLSGRGRLSGGLDYERFERDYGDDPATKEYTLWGQYRTRFGGIAQAHVKVSRAERAGDGQDPVSAAPSDQNPRMTWFNVADRSRTALDVGVQVSPTERTSVGVSSHLVDDDFDDTVIGRTDLVRLGVTLDASARPRENATVYAYASHDRYRTDQRNSTAFGVADWRGDTEDAYVTAGLGGELTGIGDKFDLGLDIMYMDSTGEVDVDTGSVERGFPDLATERLQARLRGEYQVRKNLRLGMSLGYERYRSDAWMLDGVDVDTAARLLALGEDSPSYDVVTSVVSIEYGF